MKVCHITSVHKSQDVRILKKQCTSLAKAGYEVYLVAPGESYEENGVQVVGVGEHSGGRLKRMTQMTRRVYKKALELDCDIYELHDPELLPFALKLKRKGKKVIFDSHEDYYLLIRLKKYLPSFVRTPAAKMYRIYSKSIFAKIDAVLFPCLKDGQNIFEGQCARSLVVGNEPLLSELYDAYDEHVQKDGHTVCYVGALTYNRGIRHIVKANAKAGSKLILAGGFTPLSLKTELEATPEYNQVSYRGSYTRAQLIDILQVSVVGMATLLHIGQYNIFDNFVTKVYEYMAMGLPVIMSCYSFAQKANEKYDFAILVDPENIEEIASAIQYLIENPEHAKQMGENGRRAIKEEFNWEREETKLLALYAELVQEIEKNKIL